MLFIFASFMEITDWYSFSSIGMVCYTPDQKLSNYLFLFSSFLYHSFIRIHFHFPILPHSYILPSVVSNFIATIMILYCMSQKSCIYIHLIFLYINLVLVTAVFFHCLPSFHSNLLPTNIFVAIRTVCYLATYTIQFHMYIVPLIKVLYHCTV